MLPPNPHYGSGLFRRRVCLRVASRHVTVELEDSNHAFRLVLRHDGERVTAIEPDYVRHPFTTCPESARHLAVLIDQRLDGTPFVRRMIETRSSCTHVTDMTALALTHALEDGLVRLYDITVDDERDGRTRARVDCDGRTVHDWVCVGHAVVEPATHAGQPMMRGFHAWTQAAFPAEAFEAALMLQRGYFVAQSRRYVTEPEREHPAIGDGLPEGVCYSYSTPVVQRARRIAGSKRDFTDDAGELLRFRR